MALETEFTEIPLASLHAECEKLANTGWRFIETHCVNAEDKGIDIYYAFMQGNLVRNLVVRGVEPEDEVPSVTDICLAAFVFENEARELFGVNMKDIAIDFGGKMYAPADETPMCFISPQVKAEKEKAKKMALAMEAKKKKAAALKAQKEAEAKAAAAAPAPAAKAPAVTGDPLKEHPTKIDVSESGKVADVTEIPAAKVPTPHSLDTKDEGRAPVPAVEYPCEVANDTKKEGE